MEKEKTNMWTFIKKYAITIVAVLFGIFCLLTSNITIHQIQTQTQTQSQSQATYAEALNITLVNNEMISGKTQVTYMWLKMKLDELTGTNMHPMFSSFQYLYMKVLWHPNLRENEVLVGVPVIGKQQTNVIMQTKIQTQTNKMNVSLLKWLGI